MAKAKVGNEKLMAKAQAEQLLKKDQLMVEIDASRPNSKELARPT